MAQRFFKKLDAPTKATEQHMQIERLLSEMLNVSMLTAVLSLQQISARK